MVFSPREAGLEGLRWLFPQVQGLVGLAGKGALSWAPARRSQPGCIPVRQVFSNIAEATWLFSPGPDVTGHHSHCTPLGEAVPKPLDSKGRPWAVPPDERNMEESGADLRAVMGPLLFVLPFVKKVIPL